MRLLSTPGRLFLSLFFQGNLACAARSRASSLATLARRMSFSACCLASVYDPDGWWNPLRVYSVGTCVVQWGIALAVLLAFNRRLAARSLTDHATLGG